MDSEYMLSCLLLEWVCLISSIAIQPRREETGNFRYWTFLMAYTIYGKLGLIEWQMWHLAVRNGEYQIPHHAYIPNAHESTKCTIHVTFMLKLQLVQEPGTKWASFYRFLSLYTPRLARIHTWCKELYGLSSGIKIMNRPFIRLQCDPQKIKAEFVT